MKDIYCFYKISLQLLLPPYILHFKKSVKNERFHWWATSLHQELGRNCFLNRWFDSNFGRRMQHHIFQPHSFFFHWSIWNKNLLSTEKTETQVIKEQDDPAKESVGHFGLHLCTKHKKKEYSFLEWRIVGKMAWGARTNIPLLIELDYVPEGWKELEED